MRELDLEVETSEKSLYVSFSLGTRASVDLICRGCELETSGILLPMDPKKVEALMSWERQKSVLEISSSLGLAGYYKRCIENFS